jgi:23S rRNA (cytidine2498-2'-O)-methyltransferase
MPGLFLHCRAGFENDCAAEIQTIASEMECYGYCKTRSDSAYVVFHASTIEQAHEIHTKIDFDKIIFARQWFVFTHHLTDLPEKDRVTPINESIHQLGKNLDSIHLESPDSDAGRSLSSFLKKFRHALKPEQFIDTQAARDTQTRCLHLCMIDSHEIYIGYANPRNSAPWTAGIPRLKMSGHAPSRSALKLEEAIIRFLTPAERSKWLSLGKRAVDLGASPGGWTWVLVQHSLDVISVDNGPIDEAVMNTGLVTHAREDAFTFKPDKPVDWLVCDVVDKPARVLERIAYWFNQGYCRRAIFNIKLPMKKRFHYIDEALNQWVEGIVNFNNDSVLKCKQLYHDRQEITVYLKV